MDAVFSSMIDAALVEGGDASLKSVLPNIDFSQVDELLNGLSSF